MNKYLKAFLAAVESALKIQLETFLFFGTPKKFSVNYFLIYVLSLLYKKNSSRDRKFYNDDVLKKKALAV